MIKARPNQKPVIITEILADLARDGEMNLRCKKIPTDAR